MAGFFGSIKEKIMAVALAPGAKQTKYVDEYDDDDDLYDEEYYDDDDEYEEEEAEPVQVHYTQKSARSTARSTGSASSARTSSSTRTASKEAPKEAAKPSNVYSLQSQASSSTQRYTETVISKPKVIDDAVEIGNHVRGGRMCIVDLTNLPAGEAQRIADYLGGVCLALDGVTTRVNNGIFTVSPQNHKVMTDYRDDASFTGSTYKKASNE